MLATDPVSGEETADNPSETAATVGGGDGPPDPTASATAAANDLQALPPAAFVALVAAPAECTGTDLVAGLIPGLGAGASANAGAGAGMGAGFDRDWALGIGVGVAAGSGPHQRVARPELPRSWCLPGWAARAPLMLR